MSTKTVCKNKINKDTTNTDGINTIHSQTLTANHNKHTVMRRNGNLKENTWFSYALSTGSFMLRNFLPETFLMLSMIENLSIPGNHFVNCMAYNDLSHLHSSSPFLSILWPDVQTAPLAFKKQKHHEIAVVQRTLDKQLETMLRLPLVQ